MISMWAIHYREAVDRMRFSKDLRDFQEKGKKFEKKLKFSVDNADNND